jgi:hypothetical protein
MNFFRSTAIIILTFVNAIVFAQGRPDYSAILKGEWVVMESLLTPEIESPFISTYFKYEFDGEDNVYYATNEFERGQGGKYSVKGDTIKMIGYTYTVTSYENDQLQIETKLALTKLIHTTTLVRKEKYDGLWKLRGGDGQKLKSLPVFTGNFNLYDYLFSNYNTLRDFQKYAPLQSYLSAPTPPRHDIFLRVDLIVDSTGSVSVRDIKTAPEMNEKKTARLKKKMESTSGYWIPAHTGGKKETQLLTLTFVNRGKTSLHLKNRAIQYFRMAYQHFQKADYQGAIQRCTDAISLDQTRFQFYVLRAVCHIKLEDIDKYCKDVFMANNLNPFVSLENTEIVNGEALLIRCGGN